MFRKSILLQSMLVAMIAPSAVLAEIEATIELRNETAVYIDEGQTINQASSQLDNSDKNSAGELMKFQNQAKVFLNGDIGEESSWHGELQIIYDTEAVDDEDNGGINYRGHKNYTQNDFLRELYVDTEAAGWTWRLGKQQVVWGTADGIKLLDIINPTDFREVNQNVMEDARIPIWMINGEKYFDNGGNLQVIVSQVEENKIPGLNPGGDQGQPFIMKGVETISGNVNGFYNIAPALGAVSSTFTDLALGSPAASGLQVFQAATVGGFVDNAGAAAGFGPACAGEFGLAPSAECLSGFANFGAPTLFAPSAVNGNNFETNLTDVSGDQATDSVGWNINAPTSVFEHMPIATFATFNTFAGNADIGGPNPGLTTTWNKDYPDDWNANAGFRFKSSTESGINYSFNYFYHYDSNPYFDLSFHDAQTKERLKTQLLLSDATLPVPVAAGTPIDRSDVNSTNTDYTTVNRVTTMLQNSAGQYYGACDPAAGGCNPLDTATHSANQVELRFNERLNRIHSLGSSFDMAVDGLDVPLVIRGEFLYDRDVKQPVVDRRLLAVGDLEGALQSVDHDFFKYVIGADITVMTNLLVSGQFIQFINLDYIEENRRCVTEAGDGFACNRYTADPTTMSPTNGLQEGWETKEFISLFLSKPIGADQLGRWNNIIIWEEGGGWWDRLDAEYSLTDQFIVSGEINLYWGDEDTTFGQLDKSSNVQVGFRYIFEDY